MKARADGECSSVLVLHLPEAMRLGGWSGVRCSCPCTWAWLFSLTGLVYIAYLALSGYWRHVLLRPREIAGVWPMVQHYFLFRAKPEPLEPYNPLQKFAYTSTILFGIVAVVTGVLLAKPVQGADLVHALGGDQGIRIYHFAAMVGFLSFIPGHLVMVALHDWTNFASMWTGWRRRADYLDEGDVRRAASK